MAKKTFYLHTIEGMPAAYSANDQQICYMTHFGNPGALVPTLKQIRQEQFASTAYRQREGIGEDGSKYGYRRVCLP